MLHHRLLAQMTLLGATIALSGCFNSDDSPTGNGSDGVPADDQSAIEFVMSEDADAVEYTSTDVFFYDTGGAGAALAPVNTHRWWREPQDVSRTIEIVIENSTGTIPTASVTASGTITGLLHLWACAGDSLGHYTKAFDNSGQRLLLFERSGRSDLRPPHRGWRLRAISGVELASANTTRQINSVRVQAGDVDETVTTVSELVRLENLMQLPFGSEVLVTVDTGDATDAVFLHLRREHRFALQNNDDGTFSGKFLTMDRRGARHFVVDVLANDTLYDDQAAYDNIAWGIPFLVRGLTDSGGSGGGGGA